MRVGLAIAQALEEAHSHGVLHRDLKPANVIIPHDGRLRVLDFGLSKTVRDSNDSSAPRPDLSSAIQEEDTRADALLTKTNSMASLNNTTQELLVPQIISSSRVVARDLASMARRDDAGNAGALSRNRNEASGVRAPPEPGTNLWSAALGTPAYMAPERWLGENVTCAADLWALGTMLFEMLTSVHPFLSGARSSNDLFIKIVLAPELPTLPPELDIPVRLSQLIASMLDRDPSRRPKSKTILPRPGRF